MNLNMRKMMTIQRGFVPLLLMFALAFFPIDIGGDLTAHGLGGMASAQTSSSDGSAALSGHQQHGHDHGTVAGAASSHHDGVASGGDMDDATPCCNVGGGMCVTIASNYIQVDGKPVHGLVAIAAPLRLHDHVVSPLRHPPKI